jgi:hypothetical protein
MDEAADYKKQAEAEAAKRPFSPSIAGAIKSAQKAIKVREVLRPVPG